MALARGSLGRYRCGVAADRDSDAGQLRVPMLVLTGFLGAGKTTALNRVLGALRPGGRRVALLVNDLGRVNVDAGLLASRGSDLIELSGGCVCCKVDLQVDLWRGIHDLIARTRPDHVVLETTGIAEPAALLEGLGTPGNAGLTPAGVVTVVDAEVGAHLLETRAEARAQAEVADRVLLSKLDLAAPEAALATRRALAAAAPEAELAAFAPGVAGDVALAAWLLAERPLVGAAAAAFARGEGAPPVRPARAHAHRHGQLGVLTWRAAAPMLEAALREVLDAQGPRLLRAKGQVWLAGAAGPHLLQRAGARTELVASGAWAGAPRTELVLIGDDLDEAALERALWACTTRPG